MARWSSVRGAARQRGVGSARSVASKGGSSVRERIVGGKGERQEKPAGKAVRMKEKPRRKFGR